MIWGIGAAGRPAARRSAIRTFADLRRWTGATCTSCSARWANAYWHLSRGEDSSAAVSADRAIKSISNETTFAEDISDPDLPRRPYLAPRRKGRDRAKARGLAGRTVTLETQAQTISGS